MPTFRTDLPPVSAVRGFSLKRTPASATLRGMITSERLLVCDTHFWHGRTLPCERIVNDEGKTVDDSLCQACREKQGYRTHVYVSCFQSKTKDHFIFECTDAAAKPMEEFFQANGSLRGCIINAYRPKQSANGKVMIVTQPGDLSQVPLPAAPDLIAALAVIWRLPRTCMGQTASYAGRNELDLDPTVLHAMHDQVDNASNLDSTMPTVGRCIEELVSGQRPNGRRPKERVLK